jgi:hypothetical protein
MLVGLRLRDVEIEPHIVLSLTMVIFANFDIFRTFSEEFLK